MCVSRTGIRVLPFRLPCRFDGVALGSVTADQSSFDVRGVSLGLAKSGGVGTWFGPGLPDLPVEEGPLSVPVRARHRSASLNRPAGARLITAACTDPVLDQPYLDEEKTGITVGRVTVSHTIAGIGVAGAGTP